MTAAHDAADCFVCRKHRERGALIPGGPVAEDELIMVSHIVTPDVMGRDGTTAYLGHLFVEPKSLLEVAGAEHVYSAVIGDAVPHLHIHLMAKYPGTPREYWWTRLNEWPGARRGGPAEIRDLVHRLSEYHA